MDRKRLADSEKLAIRLQEFLKLYEHKSEAYKTIAKEIPATFNNVRNICTGLLSGNSAQDKTIFDFNKALDKLEGIEK